MRTCYGWCFAHSRAPGPRLCPQDQSQRIGVAGRVGNSVHLRIPAFSRNLKPSNVLVTLRDGVPVPKVIDFGIAKATTDQRLTDKTVFTAFEQLKGTPAYMSPEQAEMSEN